MGHAHNLYLNIAAETGLLGLGAYLVLVVATVWLGRRALRNRHDRALRALAVGILGSLMAYSIHSIFDMLFVQGVGVLLGLLLALLENAASAPEQNDRAGCPLPAARERAGGRPPFGSAGVTSETKAPVDESTNWARRLLNVRTAISFVIGLAVLIVVVRAAGVNLDATWASITGANPWFYLLAICSYVCTFPVRGLRWRRLLGNVGHPYLSVARLTEIIYLSWFVNSIAPLKLGDAYRGYLLKRTDRVSFSRAMGTVFAERVIDVLVLILLLIVSGVLVLRGRVGAELTQLALLAAIVIAVLVAGVLASAIRWPARHRLLQRAYPSLLFALPARRLQFVPGSARRQHAHHPRVAGGGRPSVLRASCAPRSAHHRGGPIRPDRRLAAARCPDSRWLGRRRDRHGRRTGTVQCCAGAGARRGVGGSLDQLLGLDRDRAARLPHQQAHEVGAVGAPHPQPPLRRRAIRRGGSLLETRVRDDAP